MNLIFSCIILLMTLPVMANDCTGNWERFSSEPYVGTLFPDTNNTYWRFNFQVPPNGKTILKVSGQFPHARYLNFNLYDQKTMDSLGTLPDREIHADEGNENPFWDGVSRNTTDRNYNIRVVPFGMKGTASNTIELPKAISKSSSQGAELWYRIYLPDSDVDKNGNVPLPRVEAVDSETGNPVACPAHLNPSAILPSSISNITPEPKAGNINFFHSKAANIYSDPDNDYLVGRLPKDRKEVSVFRFKAPSFVHTDEANPVFKTDAEVRYWSVCLGGISTVTSQCIADADATLDANGYATVVVGPSEIEAETKAKGLNYMGRGSFFIPFVLYRNLLSQPDFIGNLARVPKYSLDVLGFFGLKTYDSLEAQKYIGDYAPQGKYCATADFLSNQCGMVTE